MEDIEIIELYWQRLETAIVETAEKYGRYCHCIALRILENVQDADECVNDTYLVAWNTIPPHRPQYLSTFLGKITRRIAIDKWRVKQAKRRGNGEIVFALEELVDCIPDSKDVEREIENRELAGYINTFLKTLSVTERKVFVCRYWYLDSVADISKQFRFSQSKVKMMLHRIRKRMRTYLETEGFCDE